MHKIYYVN